MQFCGKDILLLCNRIDDDLLPKCDPAIFNPRRIELICGAVHLNRLAIPALLRVRGVPSQSVILEGGIVLQNILIGISPAAALIAVLKREWIFLIGSCEVSGGNDALVRKCLRVPSYTAESGPKQPN